MASESKRGCGYRKVGGLYLICEGAGMPCCKMPILLHHCPTCGGGIKQSRGWQWIDPKPWLDANPCIGPSKAVCPLNHTDSLGGRVGLIWIGARFYPTVEHFTIEANRLGICRRIHAVPRGFKLHETWVFFAHPNIVRNEDGEWIGGVFRIAKPSRIEKVVTDLDARDKDAMQALIDKGITPFVVDHDDPDHRGTVYEDIPYQLKELAL